MSLPEEAQKQLTKKAEASLGKLNEEKKKIGQVVPEGYTSLGVPYELDDTLYQARNWMCEPTLLKGRKVPRFGLMSLMLVSTPCHLYDNPVMNKITKTAFTDGINIYIHADFWRKLLDEQLQSDGKKKGPVQIIMHELMHKILRHVQRHMKYQRWLANAAQDKVINTRISLAFPELDPWADTLRETGLGFGRGDREKYGLGNMTEEAVMLEMLAARPKEIKQSKSSKKGNQPGSGSGGGAPGPGQSGGSGSGPASDEEDFDADETDNTNDAEGGASDDSDLDERFGGKDDEHTVTPEDLARRMKEGGMDESMRRLKIPDPDDKVAHDRQKNNADLQRVDAIGRAAQEMERNGGVYPGADIVTYCSDMLRAEARGKLRWRLEWRDAILNAKREMKYVEDDEPNEIYHVDEISEILGQPVYTGVRIPHSRASIVLFLFDVSGSMDNSSVQEGLTEALALKRAVNSFSDTASEVLLLQCDTHVKGNHLIEINESNKETIFKKGIQRLAQGGTNLAQSLCEAMELKQVKDKDVRAIVFITDSYDNPPKLSQLPERARKATIVYTIVSSTGMDRTEEFAKGLDHGRVVMIEDQTEVDLTEGYLERMAASPRAQSKAHRNRM